MQAQYSKQLPKIQAGVEVRMLGPYGGSYLAEDDLALLELNRLQRLSDYLLVVLHASTHSLSALGTCCAFCRCRLVCTLQ